MDFQDRPLQCLDCKNEFIFTAGEQEFYERKGFKEIVDKLVEKVRELISPPLTPVPVTPNRRRR